MNRGVCKSCGKPILWIRTTAGRPMPCDPEPVRLRPMSRFGAEKGPELFMVGNGSAQYGIRDPEGIVTGYISHFATCPDADSHRKRGKQ